MKTGIELIAKELKRVRKSPHKTIEADVKYNSHGELVQGALFLLLSNVHLYPNDWSEKFKEKANNYSDIERLTVAGVFIAAEIDRLQNK